MAMIRLQNGNGESNIHYEFDPSLKPLGEGGMGRVFRGVQVEEGSTGSKKERDVAIKCLLEDLPEHAIKRSQREASIRLKNDNLVEMIDFVVTNDNYVTHYHVVSELLNGVNLDELLEGKTTNHDGVSNPTAERLLRNYKEKRKAFVAEVFRRILSGIMALHDAGYIHRDIDPSNIMVTSDGKVKLIDFGIAKKVDDRLEEEDVKRKALTTPGQFVGKPHYAAPELILGDLNHQNYTTDVYALGIMLFQLVAGHLPFDGPHLEVCEMQLHKKVPLNEIEDRTVRKIIEKATEKDQKKRYQTAAEFRVDLDRWIAEPHPDPKPIGKWIGIAAGCLAVIGIVVYLATRPPKPPKPSMLVPEHDTIISVHDTTTIVEEIKEPVESIPIATVEEAQKRLMDKSTAKEGLKMLQQLVDSGDYQATFLMSRIYFDATAINKGNEFYNSDWQTMRDNCGKETDNAKAHDYLMDVFEMNGSKNDTVLLYELGCDFMWNERGNVRDLECAKYCIDEVKKLTNEGGQYKEAAKNIEYRYTHSPNPPKVGKKPIKKKSLNSKRSKPEEGRERPLF